MDLLQLFYYNENLFSFYFSLKKCVKSELFSIISPKNSQINLLKLQGRNYLILGVSKGFFVFPKSKNMKLDIFYAFLCVEKTSLLNIL